MAILHKIPSKQLHRVAPDLDTLAANLYDREIGFCTTDKCAYIKFDGELFPMGQGLPKPDGLSFLIGEKIEEGEGEDATYVTKYGWQPAEQKSFSTIQTNELILWTKIYGKGFAADIAFMDKYGRDIAEMLDYSNVFVAEYNETTFEDIADAVSGGKIVILKNGGTGKFTPMSTWSSGGCTFVTPVDAYGVYHSYNVALDGTWTDVPVSIGEDTPTENSDKLLTSGGAYTALGAKANSTNITPGTFTKVAVNSQGVVTNGQQLDANDIPNHSADKLTEGHLHPDRLEDGSIPAEKLEVRKKLMVDGTSIVPEETADSIILRAQNTFFAEYDVATLEQIREANSRDAVVFTIIPLGQGNYVFATIANASSSGASFRSTVLVDDVVTTYFAVVNSSNEWTVSTETAYLAKGLVRLENVDVEISGDSSVQTLNIEEGKCYTLVFNGSCEIRLATNVSTRPVHTLLYIECGEGLSACPYATISWYDENLVLHDAEFSYRAVESTNRYTLDVTLQQISVSSGPSLTPTVARVYDLPVIYRSVPAGATDMTTDEDNFNIGRLT